MKTIRNMFLTLCLLFTGCHSSNHASMDNATNQKVIYTTFFPVYDLTSRIVGDKMEVKTIIQGNQEPHDFELQTKDMAQITKADLIVYNGANMESFIPDLQQAANDDSKFLDLSQDLTLLETAGDDDHEHEEHDDHDHDRVNPHTWLSVKNAMKQLTAIYENVSQMDPENQEYYKERYDEAYAQFQTLDESFTKAIEELPSDTEKYFVVSHAAFNYLADDYGLTQVAVTGISPEEEPSAKQLATIADFVSKHNITTIFFEGKATPKVAETLAKNTNTKTDTLYTMESLTEEEMELGYIELMKRNLEALVKSFG
ncbi:MAG: zinc ABC transporter substrate-binding protein [Erysipelotrichaceae bacterium]|nr:zinc ABC transporter substrate-binding protein [Erysipelotrichaceae bacterium]